MGQRIAVSVFLALVGAMTMGGLWSAFRLHGTDAVLAISFAAVFAVTFVVQRLRSRAS